MTCPQLGLTKKHRHCEQFFNKNKLRRHKVKEQIHSVNYVTMTTTHVSPGWGEDPVRAEVVVGHLVIDHQVRHVSLNR